MVFKYDFLIIGAGVAGMSYALKIARAHKGKVCMICKTSLEEANTSFAQSTLNTEEEAKAIEKHKKEMKDRVSIATDDAFTAYCINYHVPRSKNKQFYSLVSRREERKAAYDYIYQKSPYKRVKAKMAVMPIPIRTAVLVSTVPSAAGLSEDVTKAMITSPP